MLPAADRMPVHTKKKATGPFDRSHLLDHLKTQATNSTIGEDYVPFTKKQTQVHGQVLSIGAVSTLLGASTSLYCSVVVMLVHVQET